MSKLTESLREVGVYNDHWFFNGNSPAGQVYIGYRRSERWTLPAWLVHRVGHKTDPDGHWQDYGNRSFSAFGGRDVKAAALEEAKAWAGERYGITEWARTPFGCYGDAGFVKARTKELKAEVEARA